MEIVFDCSHLHVNLLILLCLCSINILVTPDQGYLNFFLDHELANAWKSNVMSNVELVWILYLWVRINFD